MIKALMIGGGFQHQDSISINKKLSSDMVWVKNTNDYDIKVFIDNSIIENIGKDKKNCFGWIFESKSIFNTKFIYDNYKIICDSFELIFTHDEELLKLSSKFVFIPANSFWINDPFIDNKTKLISFITSNKNSTIGQKKRMDVLKIIPKFVDVYGSGINPIQKKEDGLKNYMFSICIENDKYDSYFTEKILDCFATGTIPIYWGTSNIKNYFDSDGIINLTDDFNFESLNYELYYSKLSAIKNNFNKIKKYEILEDMFYSVLKEKKLI